MSDSKTRISIVDRLSQLRAKMAGQAPDMYALKVTTTGTGFGTVSRDPEADSYIKGQVVSLMAKADIGSKFVRWMNEVPILNSVCNVRIDSPKSVFAEFELMDKTEVKKVASLTPDVLETKLQQIETRKFNKATPALPVPITTMPVILETKLQQIETRKFNKATPALPGPIATNWTDTAVQESSKKRIDHLERFINSNDGTVTDTRTGLMWMRTAVGQSLSGYTCIGQPGLFSFIDGKNITSEIGGYLDWRLPMIAELKSLIDYDADLMLDDSVFQNKTGKDCYFWSASGQKLNQKLKSDIKIFDLKNGNPKAHVRLVRCGWNFPIVIIATGNGTGTIMRSWEVDGFPYGSTVTLTASAAPSSKFKCWHGAATGSGATCSVTLDSAKTVFAEFVQLESFVLDVNTTGYGSGRITRSVDAHTYFSGSMVTLKAQVEEGSIFNGWQGDAAGAGMDSSCTIAMNSSKSVTAEFIKLDVVDLGVDVRFDMAEDAIMKNGEAASILYFLVFNNGQKQVRVELSLTSYVTSHGEEIEQSVWLSNLLLGNEGATLRPSTFRKMGLVFYKSMLTEITTGDHLYVTIFQAKPARRLIFTFRCTDKISYKFILIKSLAEETLALDENDETSLEKLEILQRINLLEDSMRDILRKLDALQIPSTSIISARIQLATTQTLSEVLAWLATKNRVSLAALRGQLLPLDLLPSAIMDQLNELALDLTGELALKQIDDEIVVSKGIFAEVLANWNVDPS